MFKTILRILPIVSAAAAALSLSVYAPDVAEAAGTEQSNGAMNGLQLEMPKMDPAKGRILFASKGCVVCHSINGVGGEDAPKLDASTMAPKMDPFDFAAKMWHGAPAMIAMQQEELGGQIEFNGEELADIIAFAHAPAEQKKFSEADIPEEIRELIAHGEMGGEHHKMDSVQHKD